MIFTNIEQSKSLLELGLDPNTADMYYTGHRSIYNPKEIEYTQVPRVRTKFVSFDRLEVFFPAWSLSALMEIMKSTKNKVNVPTEVALYYSALGWGCVWESGLDRHKEYGKEDKMDAAYEIVVWLLENEYIKSKEQ